MNCKKFFSFQILIFIFVILPCSVQATLTSITNCTGEAKNCYVTNNPPEQITKDPNNDLLLAWNEKQNVTLNSDLKVDRVYNASVSFVKKISHGFIIKKGTVVSSHYVQWDSSSGDPSSGHKSVQATINADSQIFAFITDDQKLFNSDNILGLSGIDYNDFKNRSLEPKDNTNFNGQSVEIDWQASSPGDWTRMITAYSPKAEEDNLVIKQITKNRFSSKAPMVQAFYDQVYIVWEDNQSGSQEIYFVSSLDNGKNWSTIKRLTDDDGIESTNPALEIDLNGNLHLGWRDKRGGTWSGWYMKSTNQGQTWSDPVNVTKYPSSYGFTHPLIAMTSDSKNLYMFWHDNRESGWHNPYYRISPNFGQSWNAAHRLTNERISGGNVSVSTDGQGTLHVGWRWNYDDQEGSMYKRSTDFGQSWGSDFVVGTTPKELKPCANTDGDVVLVYPKDGLLYYVYSSNQGQDVGEPSIVSNKAINPSLSSNNGAVGCQGANFYLVWSDGRHGDDNSEIYFSSSQDSGASWTNEQRISNAIGRSYQAKLFPGEGGAHIVWADNRDGEYNIFYTYSGEQSEEPYVECAYSDFDLDFTFPCISIDGLAFGLELNFAEKVSSDKQGYFWKLDIDSITSKTSCESESCLMQDNLDLKVNCLAYIDIILECEMIYVGGVENDLFGHYWKLDPSSLKVKEYITGSLK